MCNFGLSDPLSLQRFLGLLWRHWRNELLLCKTICHPLLGQNSNFFHHISNHRFFYLPFVACFYYLCELIQLRKSYVRRLYCHFALDHVKNEILLNVYNYNIIIMYIMDIIDMSQRFLFLSLASCYSGMELWRQLALKMKCLGGNAMEKATWLWKPCLWFLGRMEIAANIGCYPMILLEFCVTNFFFTWLNIPEVKRKFCWKKAVKELQL